MTMQGGHPEPLRDVGTTLAELLVAMVIAAVFLAVFGTVTVRLFDSTSNQQARADNLDTTRGLVVVLDREVRYANAINAPLVYNGSQYVTWRSGSINASGVALGTAVQTCYQWRLTTTGQVQHRHWTEGSATATDWGTVGTGVTATGSNIFSIAAGAGQQSRQMLSLSFTSTHGLRAVSTPDQISFTSLNTRTSSAPATPVCQERQPE